MGKILVSSCLAGKNCAYDGKSRLSKDVKDFICDNAYIDICPEVEGGLGCPRDMSEIVGGSGEDVLDNNAKVITSKGVDVTGNFISGAETALRTAREHDAKISIMKSKSPSCGKGKIYSGNFDGKLIDGNGVTAALLMRNGIQVMTEKEIM